MTLEGSVDKPKLPPIVVVNDYVISWLLELGVIKALERRAKEGGSYSVSVSLSKVSAYLMSLGIFDKDYAKPCRIVTKNIKSSHQINLKRRPL